MHMLGGWQVIHLEYGEDQVLTKMHEKAYSMPELQQVGKHHTSP
jgi:hypothetical protein|tara:strand:+ start:695 stop:826 length:132 start_codon:yes stop_codon:yes gene_type:complete